MSRKKNHRYKPGKADRPAFNTTGMFSELEYYHGDGYQPPLMYIREFKGKQMLGEGHKLRCGNQDGYFRKPFQRIFIGEGYTDYIRLLRITRTEAAKLFKEIFYPPATPKWPSGKGSHYGTFSGPIPHFSAEKREGAPHVEKKPNVMTNPGKKGTGYGYAGLLIGGKEYEHIPESYYTRKRVEMFNRFLHNHPFLLASATGGCFWQNPYREDPRMPDKPPPKTGPPIDPPFYPSAVGKLLGGMKDGCFNKFPIHMANPFAELAILKRFRDYLNKEGQRYMPPQGPKSTRTQSNMQYNVNITRMYVPPSVVVSKNKHLISKFGI